jgi:peptidoglycan/xylan/chitin deacetylase (PgdA/CDA1 family)
MSWRRSLAAHVYYYASLPYRRWWNRRAAARRAAPAVVLFYHRIADDRANAWTVSHRAFVRQLRWLALCFELVTLGEVRRRVMHGNPRPCASITFDDGYSENCRHAIPFLIRSRIPCTYFVTLGNVLRQEPFPHDRATGRAFPPNTIEELQAMAAAGIEIGGHTFSHPDLGRTADPEALHREIVVARRELESRVGVPARHFAFPFGQRDNLSPEAFALAREAGFETACSGYGGYNFPGDDPFHLQRIAADESLIRLKNWATVDPRKLHTLRYEAPPAAEARDLSEKGPVSDRQEAQPCRPVSC